MKDSQIREISGAISKKMYWAKVIIKTMPELYQAESFIYDALVQYFKHCGNHYKK